MDHLGNCRKRGPAIFFARLHRCGEEGEAFLFCKLCIDAFDDDAREVAAQAAVPSAAGCGSSPLGGAQRPGAAGLGGADLGGGTGGHCPKRGRDRPVVPVGRHPGVHHCHLRALHAEGTAVGRRSRHIPGWTGSFTGSPFPRPRSSWPPPISRRPPTRRVTSRRPPTGRSSLPLCRAPGRRCFWRPLHQLPGMATHLYRDMPFVMAPILWSTISKGFRKPAKMAERAHKDGLQVGYEQLPKPLRRSCGAPFGRANTPPAKSGCGRRVTGTRRGRRSCAITYARSSPFGARIRWLRAAISQRTTVISPGST